MNFIIHEKREGYPYSIHDVHISDPFILADEKRHSYFTFVQFIDKERFPNIDCSQPAFYVLESKELVNWSIPRICFQKGSFWADKDYWAPEVHIWRGKYYLISSFMAVGKYRRCQCLISDSPDGPYKPHGEPLTPEGWHCLDGSLYQDLNGRPWLVFAHEWLQVYDGQIVAIRLSDDLSKAIGEPFILFRASQAPWVTRSSSGFVTDGPFLWRLHDGKLIMLWSSFSEGGYSTSIAHSASGEILGPWIQDDIPLYGLDGGHAMLFRSFGGQLMMAMHCPNEHTRKRILLFEMEEVDGTIRIVNEITGNWYNGIGGKNSIFAYSERVSEEFHFSKNPVFEENIELQRK